MTRLIFLAIISVFSISSFKAQPCSFADKCEDIQSAHVLNCLPTDEQCGVYILSSLQSCITPNALPENNSSNCGHGQNPTVWIKITTDERANQLYVYINTPGSWQPVFSIYSGTCNNLKLINGGTINNPIPCSNGIGDPGEHQIGIPNDNNGNPQTELYVAISAVGIIDNPDFTLTAFTQAGCISCIGNDACTPDAKFTIIQRSSQRDLNDPVFSPKETVKLCVEFEYDYGETQSDWFHGLIPEFGKGWDMKLFNPASVESEPAGASWFDESDLDCYPKLSRNLPLACTYRDQNNKLRLCNFKCGTCPCSPNLPAGSPLPSGWFWNTEGGDGCTNECSPSGFYGLPSDSYFANVKLCMVLTSKSLADVNGDPENLDLTVKFNTTSMGISGCWNDPVADCALDITQIGPRWDLYPYAEDTCFVITHDTINVFDTTSIIVFDTSYVQLTDTITVLVLDTVTTTIIEYLSVTDTLIINLNIPDSSGEPKINRIIVYPNPTFTHVYVDFGDYYLMEGYSFEVLNMLGQTVLLQDIDQKLFFLDLNTWGGKGTYLLNIIDKSGQLVETKKIVLN